MFLESLTVCVTGRVARSGVLEGPLRRPRLGPRVKKGVVLAQTPTSCLSCPAWVGLPLLLGLECARQRRQVPQEEEGEQEEP